MALNKEWHRSHRMPPKATRDQLIKWHAAHAVACGCRAIPESICAEAERLVKRPRKR